LPPAAAQVCAAAGVKISYNCQKGDCGTCEAFADGKKIRVCQTIVPLDGKSFTLKTKK
jgi:succinate dehydrogenase/fumarate reductase-like Fe-S protein